MKKKLLLIALLSLVVMCLFAFSVSAKTITYEGEEIELVDNLGDPTWYTGDTATAIQDKESIVILKDSDGNMTAYPAYYILKFRIEKSNNEITNVSVTWGDQGGVTYSWLNEKAGTSYSSGSIYYIEFPYGMTKCMQNSIFGQDAESKPESNVVEIVIPDSVTTIDSQAFRRMNSCKKVTMSKNVTSLPDWAFCGSAQLQTVVFPKGSLLESTGNSFSGCTALSSINLENCTSLKTLGGSVFNECTSLRKLALPDSLEAIGNKAFYKIGSFELASDYLPKNLTTIGTHFLSGCTIQNDVLYFPEGLTSFASEYCFNDGAKYEGTVFTLVFLGKMTAVRIDNLDANSSFKGVQVIFAKNTSSEVNGKFVTGTTYNESHAYIAKDSTGALLLNKEVTTGTLTLTLRNNDPNSNSEVGSDANNNKIYSINSITPRFIFCGGDDVDLIYQVRNSISGWNYYLTTPFAYDMDAHETASIHYNSRIYQKENCGYDGLCEYTCVVCDLESEEVIPATGKHEFEADTDCTTEEICDVCKKVAVEALAHDLDITLTYANGYTSEGARREVCKREGCVHDVSSTPKALVTFKGYSKNEAGSRMCVGYEINHVSMAEYKTVNNLANFEFGTVMSTLANATDGKPLEIVDGKVERATPDTGKGNVVKANLTNEPCATVTTAIIGDYTNYQDLQLLLCAYIYDGEALSYIQSQAVASASAVAIKDLPVE